jgi:two-component system response regulator FlrC
MIDVKELHVGTNPKHLKAIEFAKNLSVSKTPVLINGEIGTGKQALCQFIHQNSARRERPILFIDCSKNPNEVKNEILGYRDESGKFHRGVLEQGNNGTVVFLNIESLEESFQKKLFTILVELGDYDLDIRVLATSTKNISKFVGSGRFYRALYSYFSSNQVNIPPLRERKDDLNKLVDYYANYYSQIAQKDLTDISEDVYRKVATFYWTQNLNEFKLVIENAVKNCESTILDLNALEVGERKTEGKMIEDDEDSFKLMSLKDAEKLLIKKALIHTSENRTQAAKILGVSIRTLRNKINEYRSEGSQFFLNLR